MIKLRNLNKFFYKGRSNEIHVLNDISLELEEKGLVAIHGASGSGKTTLLNVIGGLDKTNSGEIDFYDEYVPRYKSGVWDKIRNEYVGYIFQNYYLLPDLSVYENVRFVLKNLGLSNEEEIEYRVNYVLKALGMYPFRKKKALQLSGGQQQRVAIARALVKNPKVIIADEPTGNLDSKNTIEIMNIIKEISKNTLVLLVTHELDVANIYADRIISLADGKIITDVVNENSSDHNVADDAIYLKDINNQDNLENEKVKVDIYYDKKLNDVNVKLIVKNDTLYVDVTGYKNVKIVDKSAGVVIKDAHYVKKTKEEVQKTTYDVKELDIKTTEKQKGLMFSLKKALFEAFKKLLTTGRKGKLMLFSFLIAGMIIAYSVANFAAVAIIDVNKHLQLPKGYVSYDINSQTEEKLGLDDFKTVNEGTTDFFINPYIDRTPLTFLKGNGTAGLYYYDVVYTHQDHAKKYKLTYGSYAEDKTEIVISKAFADNFLKTTNAQDFGIWNLDGLLQEKIKFADSNATIVGIVDTDISLVFASEEFLAYSYADSNGTYKPKEAFSNIVLKKGVLPVNDNEALLNEDSLSVFGYKDINAITFPLSVTLLNPQTFKNETYLITGVHSYEESHVIVLMDVLKDMIIKSRNQGYIYANEPNKVIKNLDEKLGLEGVDLYEDAYQSLKATRTRMIATASVTALILLGATLVGFYFVIRSSLIERIYEVAVYRALGVKKREIFSSYIVEIASITTITSIVGFLLMSYILALINQGFIGMFLSFVVNPLTVLIGILLIYTLNILAGLLPVFLLLRKTPAQILSQYDI